MAVMTVWSVMMKSVVVSVFFKRTILCFFYPICVIFWTSFDKYDKNINSLFSFLNNNNLENISTIIIVIIRIYVHIFCDIIMKHFKDFIGVTS